MARNVFTFDQTQPSIVIGWAATIWSLYTGKQRTVGGSFLVSETTDEADALKIARDHALVRAVAGEAVDPDSVGVWQD